MWAAPTWISATLSEWVSSSSWVLTWMHAEALSALSYMYSLTYYIYTYLVAEMEFGYMYDLSLPTVNFEFTSTHKDIETAIIIPTVRGRQHIREKWVVKPRHFNQIFCPWR